MKLNDQKLVDITNLLLSFPVILKRPFNYMAIYKGTYTFVHICMKPLLLDPMAQLEVAQSPFPFYHSVIMIIFRRKVCKIHHQM